MCHVMLGRKDSVTDGLSLLVAAYEGVDDRGKTHTVRTHSMYVKRQKKAKQ